MKTIGLIGGIGPETTVVYYRLLLEAGHTAVVINSVDLARLLEMMYRDDLAGVADYLSAEVEKLAAAGADIALIAANTPHVVFDDLQRRARLPMVSIVEATCDHAAASGLRRVGLFGTRFTMARRFFPDALSRRGIELMLPSGEEQEYVHDKYVNELLHGSFLPGTRARLLEIASRMIRDDRIDGLVLGGTELSLLLTQPTHDGIPLLDTTRIHVDAALKAAQAAREHLQ